ncbi:MAG: prolipoprotein diacylglyceryl transferase [Caldisericota bacterium]|nr:prolipoprotein diacylglyceryl transferase [Chloroflexota bacterium]MEA3313493.1 prolipoprotein diacylglyceryl transferase [Caldisericota bacterium]
MLAISIDPVAFTIGSLTVRWYGIIVGVAVILMIVITAREAKRLGITRDLYNLFLWCIIGGYIGARLAYVIYDWEHFIANPGEIIGVAGLAQNGMIIGVIVAALIYMRVTRMRFSTLLSIGDAVAVAMPLALAIARIACTINGCCTGTFAPNLPWAVVYTHPNSVAPLNVPMHPTQIYHLLWGLIVFSVVWRLRGKFKPEGCLAFFCFCLFAAGDFGIRVLRTDEPVLWGLRQAQVLDLAILVVFLPWLIIRMRRFKKQALVTELANEAELEQSHED